MSDADELRVIKLRMEMILGMAVGGQANPDPEHALKLIQEQAEAVVGPFMLRPKYRADGG